MAAEIERIESRLGELEELGEDEFTEELMAEAAQLEERRTEIDETIDGLYLQNERQHEAIKDALAARSIDGARALAREHVLASFNLLETILEQVGAGWRSAGRV